MLAVATVVAIVLFGLFYPTHFLIADEYLYFQQALAFAGKQDQLLQCPPCFGPCIPLPEVVYPPGTAMLAAVFIALGSLNSIFWLNIIFWWIGIWAIAQLLLEHKKPLFWAVYPALFLPGMVLTRTLMSDLSGFAFAAVFLWLFCGKQPNHWRLFAAAGLAGLAVLFRETNILWGLPFIVGSMVRRSPQWQWISGGFALGLLCKAVVYGLVFGDPFFLKDPGIGFSWAAVPGNLIFYAVLLMLVAPGGLWFWWKSSHPLRTEMGVAIVLFLLLYLGYDYGAFYKSGYKGLVLQGRYMLPLLPFFTVSAAFSEHFALKRLQIIIPFAAGILFFCVQMGGWAYNQEQQKFTRALQALPKSSQISFTPDESQKFLNTLLGPAVWVDGTSVSPSDLDCKDTWYAHIFSRNESADREKKGRSAEQAFQVFFKIWKKEKVQDLTIIDGTRLQIWKVQHLKNYE